MRYVPVAATSALGAVLIAVTAAEMTGRPAKAETAVRGEWMKARDMQRQQLKREDTGLMPVDVACRHDPAEDEALVKPQIRVAWVPNRRDMDWRLRIHGTSRAAELIRRAYETQGYRLVSENRFRTGATDQEWICEVWHKAPDD